MQNSVRESRNHLLLGRYAESCLKHAYNSYSFFDLNCFISAVAVLVKQIACTFVNPHATAKISILNGY